MTKPLTPPTPKPSRQNSAKRPQSGSSARDFLVRLTIPLVAAALTFGLHLQLNLDLSVAALIALLAGTSLALMHVTHQRGAMIRDLRRELLRAKAPSQMPTRNAHALPMGQSPSAAPFGVPQTTSAGSDRALNDQSFSHQIPHMKDTPPLRGAVPVANSRRPVIDEAVGTETTGTAGSSFGCPG